MTVSLFTCRISVLHNGHLDSSCLAIFWPQSKQNEAWPQGINLPLEVKGSKQITQLLSSMSLALDSFQNFDKVIKSVQLKITSDLFSLLLKFLFT